jgi:hypothetical protein
MHGASSPTEIEAAMEKEMFNRRYWAPLAVALARREIAIASAQRAVTANVERIWDKPALQELSPATTLRCQPSHKEVHYLELASALQRSRFSALRRLTGIDPEAVNEAGDPARNDDIESLVDVWKEQHGDR